jgi:hypothetical protein
MSNIALQFALKKFADSIESEFAEDFLQLLLGVMRVVIFVDSEFAKNINGFRGRYQFRSHDGQITVAAIFADGDLEIHEKEIGYPDLTMNFKDGKALMGLLITPKPDILGSLLRQEVTLKGNLNYMYKLAFMAKHLQLMALGKT